MRAKDARRTKPDQKKLDSFPRFPLTTSQSFTSSCWHRCSVPNAGGICLATLWWWQWTGSLPFLHSCCLFLRTTVQICSNFHPLLKRASVGTGIWWYLHCEIFRDVSGSTDPQLFGGLHSSKQPAALAMASWMAPAGRSLRELLRVSMTFPPPCDLLIEKTQPLHPRIPQTPAIYWCIALK